MGDVNTELGCGTKGRKTTGRRTVYEWETCTAEQFINHWLPLFERKQLRPEDAPVSRIFAVEVEYGVPA